MDVAGSAVVPLRDSRNVSISSRSIAGSASGAMVDGAAAHGGVLVDAAVVAGGPVGGPAVGPGVSGDAGVAGTALPPFKDGEEMHLIFLEHPNYMQVLRVDGDFEKHVGILHVADVAEDSPSAPQPRPLPTDKAVWKCMVEMIDNDKIHEETWLDEMDGQVLSWTFHRWASVNEVDALLARIGRSGTMCW